MSALGSRLLRPERNVGRGDFVTRVIASLLLLGLMFLLVPQTHCPFALQKIALLAAAEVGLISLMHALFLRTKTYYAGLQLLLVPLLMFWLVAHHHAVMALIIGALFLLFGLYSLATRRCYLNAALNLSSLTGVIAEVTAPESEKKPLTH